MIKNGRNMKKFIRYLDKNAVNNVSNIDVPTILLNLRYENTDKDNINNSENNDDNNKNKNNKRLCIEVDDEPIPEKKQKTKKIINAQIKCVQDILDIINDNLDYVDYEYNINMQMLQNIREPLSELNSMIGMKTLKNSIVDQILYFVQGLHDNSNDFLHTVIYGPPGSGKTEIAKLLGKIYSKMGILSKGTFKKVTRSDLIAGYLGQTALKTKDVINDALGGVLFIDEAYSLGNPEKRDSFAKECIDTLCEALSDKKGELMVIIAGYENELRENFFNFNEGLNSRFNWRFKTDKYDGDDLFLIFQKMVNQINWKLDNSITGEWFKKHYDSFPYYGRDMETLLTKTKISHGRRVFCLPAEEKKIITSIDINNGYKMYLENEHIKTLIQKNETNKYLASTLYN
jgi:hypothetical protein